MTYPGHPDERAARRRAERQGYYLRRATYADKDAGSFVLVDSHTQEVVHGPGLSIEQVAEWLRQDAARTNPDSGN